MTTPALLQNDLDQGEITEVNTITIFDVITWINCYFVQMIADGAVWYTDQF